MNRSNQDTASAALSASASLPTPAPPDDAVLRRIEREIVQGLREIRYGSIEIVIQDGRVVQIERREKVRLDNQGFKVPR
jgi:hypothetical protein